MAGLVKAKKYDWKDSNLALFGSKLEKDVKKESAETEPAWQGAGLEVGLQIWRIEKFKVKHWPKDEYGTFYNGDSYIILNTYKDPDTDALKWDVHFWIGRYSTQDEYGTAAYKTVELDTLLDDGPVQHREVEGYESEKFKSYFKEISVLKGGCDTGFRHVAPEQYEPRLLHFSGAKGHIEVKEVPLYKSLLSSGDVYILDLGLKLYQWNGSGSNKDERFKAVQYLQKIKDERNGKASAETLDENDVSTAHEFYSHLQDGEPENGDSEPADTGKVKELYRLSDADGSLDMKLEAEGDAVTKDLLDPADVFLLDDGKNCIVWVGEDASKAEKTKGMTMAHQYLMKSTNPFIPITVVKQGQVDATMDMAFAA
ncbi:gelsolin-like protein 2 [Lingula anatina]|uniref:Actin-modulator n=1 Tax=Lingula anatina TaxID=7574 RepID=A0A1S3J944_LINAN|nr:gelsolin-like protein 2 [Lingula anatina]XP_013406833.1 gelsolin-like protein 2 [Lingula anatina]|eukprot:XP_013406832.1 gelsolin-like protein 2 [Lingula anatina]